MLSDPGESCSPSPAEGVKLRLDRVVVRFSGVNGTGSCPAHLCNYARTIVSLLKEQAHPQSAFPLLQVRTLGPRSRVPRLLRWLQCKFFRGICYGLTLYYPFRISFLLVERYWLRISG